jgi:hypothetical protein
MSEFIFKKKYRVPITSRGKQLQKIYKILYKDRDKASLFNSKYYLGYGFTGKTNECYINEKLQYIDDCTSSKTNRVLTTVNIYIPDGVGLVTIRKYKVTPTDGQSVFYRDYSTQKFTCRVALPGETVWKQMYASYCPALRRYINVDIATRFFSHIDNVISFYSESSNLSKANRYSGNTPPSLQELSSFIIINSCFPVFHTLVKSILPNSIYQYICSTYPVQSKYISRVTPDLIHLGTYI